MSNFTTIVNEDGSIEHINSDYDNIVANTIERNSIVPDDIVSLSTEELETMILESHKNFVRQERDRRLAESDWTQSIDSPLSNEKKAEWQTYRQVLRDIVSTITNTTDIVEWPTKP